jgi:flagellar hook-associated protein 2
MSIGGISIPGLSSGLDTEGIIAALMQIERKPLTRLQLEERRTETYQNALRDVSTRLKNLKLAAADLRSVGVWADTQTVESSDSTKVAARRLSGAGPGGYTVSVTQLARAEQRTYNFAQQASASQVTITPNDGSPVTVIDIAANATLDDVVATINGTSGAPVYAVAVNGQLVLAGKETGASATHGFTASGGPIVSEDTAKQRLGLDALYRLDGDTTDRTSSSNVITDAIAGIELTLKAPTTGVTITVGNPAPDKAAIKAKVKAFVEQYNSTVDFIRSKLEEKRDPKSTDQNEQLKGTLFGDSMLSGLLSQLRQQISGTYAGRALADIGVSTGATTGSGTLSQDAISGKLVLDEAKLDAALDSDMNGVRDLLGASGSGFAQSLEATLDPYTQASGTLDGRIASADDVLRRIKDQMDALDRRLGDREARLRAQFATLESLLSQSQAQGQWLSGQLASLSSSR